MYIKGKLRTWTMALQKEKVWFFVKINWLLEIFEFFSKGGPFDDKIVKKIFPFFKNFKNKIEKWLLWDHSNMNRNKVMNFSGHSPYPVETAKLFMVIQAIMAPLLWLGLKFKSWSVIRIEMNNSGQTFFVSNFLLWHKVVLDSFLCDLHSLFPTRQGFQMSNHFFCLHKIDTYTADYFSLFTLEQSRAWAVGSDWHKIWKLKHKNLQSTHCSLDDFWYFHQHQFHYIYYFFTCTSCIIQMHFLLCCNYS